jgi:hypothetical protein
LLIEASGRCSELAVKTGLTVMSKSTFFSCHSIFSNFITLINYACKESYYDANADNIKADLDKQKKLRIFKVDRPSNKNCKLV